MSVFGSVLRVTADKSGNKRSLRRVYLDILVDLYWHKNFAPLLANPLAAGDFWRGGGG